MELLYQTPEIRFRKIIWAAFFAILLLAVYFHLHSPVAEKIRLGRPVRIILLGKPPVLAEYQAASPGGKVRLVFVKARLRKNTASAPSRAAEVLSLLPPSGSPEAEPLYVKIPGEGDSYALWENSRAWFENWRNRPGKLAELLRYIYLLKRGNLTNISYFDLSLFLYAVTGLDTSDFTISSFTGGQGGAEEPPDQLNQGPGPEGNPDTAPAPEVPVKAEIFNASGRKGLALEVTKFLRERGVDVIFFDTWPGSRPRTEIRNHTGRAADAEQVRRLLGLGDMEIYVDSGKKKLADVTVTLGKDFKLPAE